MMLTVHKWTNTPPNRPFPCNFQSIDEMIVTRIKMAEDKKAPLKLYGILSM